MSDPIIGTRDARVREAGSGVSWGAVLAGAFVASAFSLALIALGAGIGLVSVSPWSGNNPNVATFGILAAAWFIAIELFASGIGGYLAGRLRTRWIGVHTDEVYFRDTAHGLLVWAVGAVIGAGLLASAATSAFSGAARAVGTVAHVTGATATGATTEASGQPVSLPGDPNAYFTDMLFRSDHSAPSDQTGAPMEMRRILQKPSPLEISPQPIRLTSRKPSSVEPNSTKGTQKNVWAKCLTRRKALRLGWQTKPNRLRTPRGRLASMWRFGRSFRCWSEHSRPAIWRVSVAAPAIESPLIE